MAVGYTDIGSAYRELKQFDQAKLNLDKAIELEPDNVRARKNRAMLFASQNDASSELAEAATILALSPNDQWARDALDAAGHKHPLTPSDHKPLPDLSPADVPPNLLSKVEPEYTDEARRAHVNATVLLSGRSPGISAAEVFHACLCTPLSLRRLSSAIVRGFFEPASPLPSAHWYPD
jgi:tetratricopeptide (TPR) repeat protein